MESKYFIEVVDMFNERMEELGCGDYFFEYSTNGYVSIVSFCGIPLWDSDCNPVKSTDELIDVLLYEMQNLGDAIALFIIKR